MKFVDIILLGVGQIGAGLEGCCKCEAGREKEGGKMEKTLQLRHLPHSLPQFHSFSSCHPNHKHPHHHVSSSSAKAGLREILHNKVQIKGSHVTEESRPREKELDGRRRGRIRCIPASPAHCRPTGALVIPPWCEAINRFWPPAPPPPPPSPPPPSTQPRTSRACSALTLSQCQIGDRYTADTAPKG